MAGTSHGSAGEGEGGWYTHDTNVAVPALGPVGCDTGKDPKSSGRVGPEVALYPGLGTRLL